jgi:hypothetical protein
LIFAISIVGDLYWCSSILAFRSFQSSYVTRSVIGLTALHGEDVNIPTERHHWTIESMLFHLLWLGNFPLVQKCIASHICFEYLQRAKRWMADSIVDMHRGQNCGRDNRELPTDQLSKVDFVSLAMQKLARWSCPSFPN